MSRVKTELDGKASTGGTLKNPSSLTVKGNGTESFKYDGSAAKTLNIKAGSNVSVSSDTSGNITISATDTNTDTNTSHSHSAGVGLVGSGSAGTGSGTYDYKAKLRSETALTVDSAAATTTSGRVYPVAVDKTGYLCVNVPWSDTNTDTNTTYTFATGDNNGTFKVTPSGGTASNISIKGLGSAAYAATSDFVAASHTTSHAPSNAQKNSDITKAEIEAKLTGTISTHSHAHTIPTSGSWWNGGFTQITSAGVMEAGKYIDFHNTNATTNDYDVRLQCNHTSSTSSGNTVTLPSASGTLALVSGTSNLTVTSTGARYTATNGTNELWFGINVDGSKMGLYDSKGGSAGTGEYIISILPGQGSAGVRLNGTADKADKLTTARKIGKASFDGSADIALDAVMGRATSSTSSSTYANKYTKFATIDVSGGTYRTCAGTLQFIGREGDTINGDLAFYFRSGSAITSCSVSLKWKTMSNTNYENSIVAVKVSDSKYDLYYKSLGNWDTMTVTATNVVGVDYLTFHNSQSWVDSVTAAATSSFSRLTLGTSSTTAAAGNHTHTVLTDAEVKSIVNSALGITMS